MLSVEDWRAVIAGRVGRFVSRSASGSGGIDELVGD